MKRRKRTSAAHVFKNLGRAGFDRGSSSELRIEYLLEDIGNSDWPDWLYGGRKATKQEDSEGKDFVFDSDVGKLFLQVKSSRQAAEKFRRSSRAKRGMIAVVVVRSTNCQEGLRDKIIHKLSKLRDQILERRGGK